MRNGGESEEEEATDVGNGESGEGSAGNGDGGVAEEGNEPGGADMSERGDCWAHGA
jgi:hypothetical protein